MTEVKFTVEDDIIVGFEIKGHANYAPKGKDIVCSAISTSSTLTANILLSIIGDTFVECSEDDGYMKVIIIDNEESEQHTVQVVLKSFLQVIQELEEGYPDNVKIVWRDMND